MGVGIRFWSSKEGMHRGTHWSLPAAGVFAIWACAIARAETPALPPPTASAAPVVTGAADLRLIPGVPLGPHKPNTEGALTGFVDSGINAEHPQLKGLVVAERDFTGEGPGDSENHGTIVALVFIKAHFDSYKELKRLKDAGVSVEIDKLPALVSAKVIGRTAVTAQEIVERMVKAIRWLSEMQVKIVNISMALPDGAADYTALCREIEAQDQMSFAIAAGNEGPGSIVYPAACAGGHKIVVGAVTADGKVADYSGPGDLVAPGSVTLVSEAAYWRMEGERLARTGQFTEAGDAYMRALRFDPSNHEASLIQYGLGYLALQRGETDHALLSLEKSAAAWPQYPEPYVAMSIILTGKGQFEEARRSLADGVARGADSARLRDRYARVLLDLDRPDDALVQLDALQKIDPSFEDSGALRLTAQNMSNVLRHLEGGTSPAALLDAFLTAGDDAQLVGFVVRKSGLNPNTVVSENAIPLLVRAAALDRYRSCVMLLQLGADVNARDAKYHITALMIAATKGNEKLAKVLVSRRAGLNMRDYAGYTPLMFAAEAGHTPIVKLLLEGGADPSMRSQESKSALDYAIKYKHSDAVKLLKGAVAADR